MLGEFQRMNTVKVFKNATIINGINSDVVKEGMVVVDNDRITYVGEYNAEYLKLHENEQLEVIDVQHKIIMPGMIDAHVHLTLEGEAQYLEKLIVEDAKFTILKGLKKAEKMLRAGFTTVRCVGEKGQIDVHLRNAINAGIVNGPNILASGKAITTTGGHGDMLPDGIRFDGISTIADGMSNVQLAVREQLKLNVDNIKLMATGGGMSPGDAKISQLTVEEMAIAVKEAEKFDIVTAAHAIGREGINNALQAGVRTIEHGTYIDQDGIHFMKNHDVFLVPTLAAFKTIKYGEAAGVPKHHLEKVQSFERAHIDNLKRALDAGVKVITGTDAGTPFNYHGENAYELEALTNVGMTPMDTIIAATSRAAEALKLEDRGVLKEGCIADLIIVDGNPLHDIMLLQKKVEKVYKNGQEVTFVE